MRRRQFLGAAGLSVSSLTAGCLHGVLGSSRAGRRVSLTDVGTVGDDHPVALEATLRSSVFGPESAPELVVTLRSSADEKLLLRYAESWPADGLLPDRNSIPRGLRLLATGEYTNLTVEFEDCPRTAYRPITSESDGQGHVRPDAEVRAGYRAVGSADALAEACPEAGRYRVRSTYAYQRAPEVERVGIEDAERHRFTWGFTIEIPSDG